ncbi:MAG: P-loop NTPase fold protein [Chloroflexi bacterium]|nr:P-loop NTPase fold protein [Chloroflexota bacterium]
MKLYQLRKTYQTKGSEQELCLPLPEETQNDLMVATLDLFREIEDEDRRADELIAVAPDFPAEYRGDLLTIARGIADRNARSRALIYLQNKPAVAGAEPVTEADTVGAETPSGEDPLPPAEGGPSEEIATPATIPGSEVQTEESEAVQAPEQQPEREQLEPEEGAQSGAPAPEEPVTPVATFFHTDKWTLDDKLGYSLYAKAIAEFIYDTRTEPPLTVGVFAPWGQGKTTLMRLIEFHLTEKSKGQVDAGGADAVPPANYGKGVEPPHATFGKLREWLKNPLDLQPSKLEYPTVCFNAWKYQDSEQVWAGMAHSIITQLVEQLPSTLDREKFWLALQAERLDTNAIRQDVHRLVFERLIPKVVGWVTLGVLGLGAAIAGAIATLASSSPLSWSVGGAGLFGLVAAAGPGAWHCFKTKSQVLAQPLQGKFNHYVRRPDYESKRGYFREVEEDIRRVFELLVDPTKPAVVFVDDLDRCFPGRVADVLDAINLFLSGDFPNTYFVIGMDAQVAAASMEVAHKELTSKMEEVARSYGSLGWYFMDKFIQLPFPIPNLTPDQEEEYLVGLFGQTVSSGNGASESRDEVAEQRRAEEAEQQIRNALEASQNTPPKDWGPHYTEYFRTLRRSRPEMHKQLSHSVVEVAAQRSADDDKDIQNQLATYGSLLSGNPRTMKRFANLYRFYRLMQSARQSEGLDHATHSSLAYWITIMLRWPQLVRWIQWEDETQLVQQSKAAAKAAAFDQLINDYTSYEDWIAQLSEKDLDRLLGFADSQLFEFSRAHRSANYQLTRAITVGVW